MLDSLTPRLIGGGEIRSRSASSARLWIPPTESAYADSQLEDYTGLLRSAFPWAPPVTLRLRARASHASPPGTLGFGFWNDPFGVSLGGAGGAQRFPASPQAAWFFYGSPPNDFTFVDGGSGDGWKAAVIRGPRLPAALLVPAAAGAVAAGLVPGLRRLAVSAVRGAIHGAEALVAEELDAWHEYAIEWRPDGIEFTADGRSVLSTTVVPQPPLGFVTWIDNQYAVLSSGRGIRFGTLSTTTEGWLDLADLELKRADL